MTLKFRLCVCVCVFVSPGQLKTELILIQKVVGPLALWAKHDLTRRQCRTVTQVWLGRSCMKLQCFGKKLQTLVTRQFFGLHSARTLFCHKWQCPRLRTNEQTRFLNTNRCGFTLTDGWKQQEVNLHVYLSSPFKQSTPRFWMMDENTAISTPRQNSSRPNSLDDFRPQATWHILDSVTYSQAIERFLSNGAVANDFVCKVNKVHTASQNVKKSLLSYPFLAGQHWEQRAHHCGLACSNDHLLYTTFPVRWKPEMMATCLSCNILNR